MRAAQRTITGGHPVVRMSGTGEPEMMFGMTRERFMALRPEAQEALIRAEYAQDEARMLAALGALRNGTDTLRAWFTGDQRLREREIQSNAETERERLRQDGETERRYIDARNQQLQPGGAPPPPPPPPPPATPAAGESVAVPGWGIALGGLALLGLVYAVTRDKPQGYAARPMPNPDPSTRRTGGRCQCNGRGSFYNRATGKFARCPCRGG